MRFFEHTFALASTTSHTAHPIIPIKKMKFSTAVLFASMASTASAAKTISGKTAGKVMRAARQLEQNQQGDDAGNEFDYLAKYSLKMIGCKAGETVVDAETGEYEYSAAIFRLCPTESGCDSDAAAGCKEGYGDFVVGLNTFVNAYFEDQRDNMQWDDQFQVDRYAECEMYEMEEGDDANQNAYANYQFYIGPTCTEDELDVRLALFEDETCSYESEIAFEDVSNGWSLPYSEGGMVSTYCQDCLEYDEDQGAYDLREMCQRLYEETSSACEAQMPYTSYYGVNTNGCEYIEEITPAAVKGKNGGKIFGWLVFFLLVGGVAGYIVWWRSSKFEDDDEEWEDEYEQEYQKHETEVQQRRRILREQRRRQRQLRPKWWHRFVYRRR